jgi:hypothetical protein
MKRSDAIKFVTEELRSLSTQLSEGKKVPTVKFVNLSEVFKFRIEPKEDRFTAVCLDEMAQSTDIKKIKTLIEEVIGEEKHDCEKIHPEMTHEEWETSEEGEVNELVDFDGTMQSSKIPVGTELNKTISPKKTTDDTIKMANQSLSMMGTGGGSGTYFRRYYGESIEEADLSKTLGFDETQDMDAKETIEYFEDEHDMDGVEAEERAESMGKTQNLDKKSDDDETYQRLTERQRLNKLSEIKAREMIEVILSNKEVSGELSRGGVVDTKVDDLVGKLVKLIKDKGMTTKELISLINSKR